MSNTPVIDAIFKAFGGPTKLADALGEPVSTVHAWKTSKYGIPRWRRPHILKVSKQAVESLPPEAMRYLGSSARIAA